MAELAERLGLDLADPLAGHIEVATHLFERATAPVLEAESQLEHAPLARCEAVEHSLHLLLEELVAGGIGRGDACQVWDEVTQVGVLLLADRRLQADRLLADLHDLAHLLRPNGLRSRR